MSEKTSDFDVFIGIDQTGALLKKGVPKKLPAAVLHKKNGKLIEKTENLEGEALYVESFKKDSFLTLIESLGINHNKKKIFIGVDCVLGFSEKIINKKDPYRFLKTCFLSASKTDGYGLKVSDEFFKNLEKKFDVRNEHYLRRQEIDFGCLSVFKNKPFQKNVQTGTFRIWKDLGENKEFENFNIWPYEIKKSNILTICEAYPSLYRKKIKIKKQFKSKDHEDAYLIARFASLNNIKPRKNVKEGFILS